MCSWTLVGERIMNRVQNRVRHVRVRDSTAEIADSRLIRWVL